MNTNPLRIVIRDRVDSCLNALEIPIAVRAHINVFVDFNFARFELLKMVLQQKEEKSNKKAACKWCCLQLHLSSNSRDEE